MAQSTNTRSLSPQKWLVKSFVNKLKHAKHWSGSLTSVNTISTVEIFCTLNLIIYFLSCSCETLMNLLFPCWAVTLIDTFGLGIGVELPECFSQTAGPFGDTSTATEDYLMNYSCHLGKTKSSFDYYIR